MLIREVVIDSTVRPNAAILNSAWQPRSLFATSLYPIGWGSAVRNEDYVSSSLRPIDVFPITTRVLDVLRVSDVTPGMRRVTLGGPGLAAHTADTGYPVQAFRSDGFDDEFKIILKHPDADVVVAPTQADGVLNWPMDNPLLVARTYTVRRWDPAAGEIDVDVVRHDSGPAGRWAQTVEPGEQVQIAGPKASSGQPEGADWILAAGDETALPAIGRWLENWPHGVPGQIFIEVAEQSHRQQLTQPDGVQLTWLVRDGAPAGTTSLLHDAVRAAPWWEGRVFVWLAGESLTLAPIRRWLRHEKQLPKAQLDVTGYWRRQPHAEDAGGLDVLGSTATHTLKLQKLADIVPGFAIRTAITMGLAAALESGPRTSGQIAAQTAAPETGIAKLLRYLASLGLVSRTADGRYGLTDFGAELNNDHLAGELDFAADHALRELAGLLCLTDAVESGRHGGSAWFSDAAPETVLTEPAVVAERIADEATKAGYLAGPLAHSPELRGLGSLAVMGLGAAVIASVLVREHDRLQVTVLATPAEIEVLRASAPAHERVRYAPADAGDAPEPTDAVLLVNVLNGSSDADAARHLRAIADGLNPGGRILVLTEVFDAQRAYPHDYAEDLIDFGLFGGGSRDHGEYASLFAAAGLGGMRGETLGWGFTLVSLAPRRPQDEG